MIMNNEKKRKKRMKIAGKSLKKMKNKNGIFFKNSKLFSFIYKKRWKLILSFQNHHEQEIL